MATVVLFHASFCGEEAVASAVADELGLERVGIDRFLQRTAAAHGLAADKLVRAMQGKPSVFNKFTHERERAIASMRAGLAELLAGDDFLLVGFPALLVPASVTHALRVCLVGGPEHRVQEAMRAESIDEREARARIDRDDEQCAAWARTLFELGPWDRSLYDVMIPMDRTSTDEAAAIVCENARKPALARTAEAAQAAADFRLATAVNVELARHGHDVDVASEDGEVLITINRYVLRLDRLEQELAALAMTIEGVKRVTTAVGPRFHQPNIYVNLDADMPSKVLLVDDEKEFVHTLSERLQTRQLGAAVAYSGEEALAIIESDEPEVVVLDLQMPGIHGIEVLRQVKKGHPRTEVIILTGHGSEREEAVARELGAFAYLHKPVDINELSKTMRDAYRKQLAGEPAAVEPTDEEGGDP